jgi:hypothetical protein
VGLTGASVRGRRTGKMPTGTGIILWRGENRTDFSPRMLATACDNIKGLDLALQEGIELVRWHELRCGW